MSGFLLLRWMLKGHIPERPPQPSLLSAPGIEAVDPSKEDWNAAGYEHNHHFTAAGAMKAAFREKPRPARRIER